MNTKVQQLADEGLQRHPLSHAYPEMSPIEFDSLVRSMLDNGFDSAFPIILYDDMIIDGWHRYNAAIKVNIEPVVKHWEGSPEQARQFIIYANSTRRHLSAAAHAQALLAMESSDGVQMPDIEIIRISGVSQATLALQKRLRTTDPDVASQVAKGKKPAETAVREILKPKSAKSRGTGTAWGGSISKALSKRMYEAARLTGLTPQRFITTAIDEHINRVMSSE